MTKLRAYFPGANLTSGVLSGYVVPALRADASGSICVAAQCTRYDGVQSYHDHNWGVWRGVTWQWGAARAGSYTFVYGRVEPRLVGEKRTAPDKDHVAAGPFQVHMPTRVFARNPFRFARRQPDLAAR